MPKAKITLRGTLEKQAAYTQTVLALAERKRFRFVVLFIHQDYDRLWDTIKASAPELFMAWRDCGLIANAVRLVPPTRSGANTLGIPWTRGNEWQSHGFLDHLTVLPKDVARFTPLRKPLFPSWQETESRPALNLVPCF